MNFLDHASRAVLPVLQRCSTHAGLRQGRTGLLLYDSTHLHALLDGLVAALERCQALARNAHCHLSCWRRDLEGLAELAFQARQEALQGQQRPRALDHFRKASAGNPLTPDLLTPGTP